MTGTPRGGRSGAATWRWARWGLLLGLLGAARRSEAQSGGRNVSALPRQTLDFGTLIAGAPARVSRSDALHTAQIELRGQKGLEVRIDFALPQAMRGPNGAAVPLTFGLNDGGYSTDPVIGAAQAFDPRSPLLIRFGSNGKLFLYLGGMATPSARQQAGAYGSTITVTVAYTGS